MSSKSKSKKNSTTHYYGCVYGGIMKQGYVSFFSTTEDPEEYFVQYKDWYGHKVRGRYVKASDEEDYLEKVEEKLNEQHVYNKIYEVSVDTASKTLKELTGAKKTSLLGEEDGNKESVNNNNNNDEGEKKIKVKSSNKAKKSEEEEDKAEEITVSKKETKKEDKKESKKPVASKSSNNKKSKAVESEEDSDQNNDDDNEPSEADSDNEEAEVKPVAKVVAKKDKKEPKAKLSK